MKIVTPDDIDLLAPSSKEWLRNQEPGYYMPFTGAIGRALSIYLLLTERPETIRNPSEFAPVEVFYSRYYWYLLSIRLWQKFNGPDDGMEQRAYQILESSEYQAFDVDWNLMEVIENRLNEEVAAFDGLLTPSTRI